ncbi:MAG: heavy metal translocating P-type ATPase [Caldilineales bacterium]
MNGAGKTGPAAIRVVEYEVAHQVRGRLRLRIPRLGFDAPFGERLAGAVMELQGVKRARVSKSSASLVVEYKPKPAGASAADTMLPQVVECIRVAAEADRARDVTPAPGGKVVAPEPPAKAVPAKGINPVGKLTLPALTLGLSAGMLAGLAVPPVLMGGIVLVAATPIFGRALQGIREEKRLTVETLDATAIVLMTSQAIFLGPAIIISVVETSALAREYTARRARKAAADLWMSLEHRVQVERNGQQLELGWDEIKPGDEMLLYPGDQIPVDGLIIAGEAQVDQHRVTGDSLPVLRQTGDSIHATALLVDGHLRVVAGQTGDDTHVGRSVALMDAAPEVDSRVSNWARRKGNWTVMPVLAISGAVYAGTGSLAQATSIVNLDVGTGLRVGTPIAVLTAQSRAARRGILIRSGRALEKLAEIDTVMFDKTATLTNGQAAVIDVLPHGEAISAHDVLALASSAEQSMNHPVGQAIVHHARRLGIDQQEFSTWDYIPGLGVVAEIDGATVRVGNSQLMVQAGIDVSQFSANGRSSDLATATRVFVSRDDQLAGAIYCADRLRPESAAVIEQLCARDVQTLMVTGDRLPVAAALAASLEIPPEHVHAGLLPHQKLEILQALQAERRKVAVVGDGINDVAAMAHADVSIALGCANDLARETADVVLANDDLRDLLTAIEIGRQAVRVLRQNTALVTIPNLSGVAYGALTVMNPLTAMIINNGAALAAALNSVRPLKYD